MAQYQISTDNLASLGGTNITLDPKMLICSLCCCINYNCVQCANKKCLKLFCDDCSFKIKIAKGVCPFCRIPYDYKKAEAGLYEILKNILFFCDKTTQCREKYSLSSFKEHSLHHPDPKGKEEKCNECLKVILTHDPNSAKCGICLRLFCFSSVSYNAMHIPNYLKEIKESNCLRKCFECKLHICFSCNPEKRNMNVFCDNCELKCLKCQGMAKVTCSFCDGRLCNDCIIHCPKCKLGFCKDKLCYSKKSQNCVKCKELSKKSTEVCLHQKYYACGNCYPKCCKCQVQKANVKCVTCKSLLCLNYCSIKCKHCNQATCLNCSLLCSICKAVLCSMCSKRCSICPKDQSLTTCLKCNSDTIRTCSFPECKTNLCLACWNVCNYCNIIYCSQHSLSCLNCEESMCNQHYQICKDCSQGSSYRKLCLKKCSYKCAFCPNTSNVLCDKRNHLKNYVSNYNCEHYVCLSCIKNCFKCQKAVITCPQCIVNYYFVKCKFCENYLCNSCSVRCNNCENSYCDLEHICFICKTKGNSKMCINCSYSRRLRCQTCHKTLPQCSKCSKRYICGYKCYNEYMLKSKDDDSKKHLCEMYRCLNTSLCKESTILIKNKSVECNCCIIF